MKISSYQVENYIKKIADEKISGCLLYGPEPTITRFRFENIAKKIVNNLRKLDSLEKIILKKKYNGIIKSF